jgi:hypothetical protein
VEEEGDEDVDTDDCKVGFSDGCDWPAAVTSVPSGDGCNKWINCAYIALPVTVEREIINVINELITNSSRHTDLNFIIFSDHLSVFYKTFA